jgi:single-strand DNA-binding protein
MGINTATLSGNLGKDPLLTYLDSGSVVASFSIAVQGFRHGEKTTLWFDCKAWNKTAEVIADYTKKGSPVTVSGNLDVEEWIDRDSNSKRSKVVLVVRDIQLPPRAEGQRTEDISY